MRRILSGFGLLTGATYPFRALNIFVNNPYLCKYLVVPICINLAIGIILYTGLLLFGWEAIGDWMLSLSQWLDRLIVSLPKWLSFLDYLIYGLAFILRFLLAIAALAITGLLLTQFGVILGAPWYGKLSEQLERLRTGKLEIIEVGIIRDVGRAILYELKKLVLLLLVGLPLLMLNFIPGVGTIISTVGGFILTANIVCLDFLDSTLERRRLRFRRKLGIIWSCFPATAGFALVCFGLISIPLLNLFTIPLCVASGTLFCCDRILPQYFPSSSRIAEK